jgi:hypothetical protein
VLRDIATRSRFDRGTCRVGHKLPRGHMLCIRRGDLSLSFVRAGSLGLLPTYLVKRWILCKNFWGVSPPLGARPIFRYPYPYPARGTAAREEERRDQTREVSFQALSRIGRVPRYPRNDSGHPRACWGLRQRKSPRSGGFGGAVLLAASGEP